MSNFHVEVGDNVSFTKTVSESDVYLFAGITGDLAPNHVNDEYMKRSKYGKRMVHGALLVGFISTASTMAIEKSRSSKEETPVAVGFDRVRFIMPVFLGETITVTYTVDSIDLERRRSMADVKIVNQDGTLVCVATHLLQWVKNE
ncbi:MAG: MaoC/PaaZ C-terminal domain-containing protein [Chloroflexota bacterium]